MEEFPSVRTPKGDAPSTRTTKGSSRKKIEVVPPSQTKGGFFSTLFGTTPDKED